MKKKRFLKESWEIYYSRTALCCTYNPFNLEIIFNFFLPHSRPIPTIKSSPKRKVSSINLLTKWWKKKPNEMRNLIKWKREKSEWKSRVRFCHLFFFKVRFRNEKLLFIYITKSAFSPTSLICCKLMLIEIFQKK